jgi:hypothetical protein
VNISRKDAGLYSCFAVNIMGNSTSDVRWVLSFIWYKYGEKK